MRHFFIGACFGVFVFFCGFGSALFISKAVLKSSNAEPSQEIINQIGQKGYAKAIQDILAEVAKNGSVRLPVQGKDGKPSEVKLLLDNGKK